MTRQEILNTPEIVDFMIDKSVMVDSKMKLHKRLEELCKLAIKALEQQPCEDCISREYLINKISSVDGLEGVENSNLFAKHYMDIVKSAPSVTPTRPTARWERLVDDYKKCSKCGRPVKFYRNYKHCPGCGSEMQEVEG